MKRYLLLVGDSYYPAGWDDWAGSFDTIEEAKAKAETIKKASFAYNGKWSGIFDSVTQKEVGIEGSDV